MITIGSSGRTPPGATLRTATPDDLDLLRRLRRAARIRGEVPATLATLLEVPSLGRVWLLEVHATPAGYLAVDWGDGDAGRVAELVIVPALRGHGLGSWALAVAEAACRGRGIRELRIEVEQVVGAVGACCEKTVRRLRMFVPAA